MQTGQIIPVRTDPGVQFVDAIIAGAIATASLPQGPNNGQVDGGLSAGGSVRSILRALQIVSVQQKAWEVSLWGNTDFNASGNPDNVIQYGKYAFAEADGVRYGGAGLYFYYVAGLYIPYCDLLGLGQLHLGLANRSATDKLGGAGGSVMVQLHLEPAMGW